MSPQTHLLSSPQDVLWVSDMISGVASRLLRDLIILTCSGTSIVRTAAIIIIDGIAMVIYIIVVFIML